MRRTFAAHSAAAMDEVYADVIAKYTAQGLLRRSENHVALTEAGMKLGNEVFRGIFYWRSDSVGDKFVL